MWGGAAVIVLLWPVVFTALFLQFLWTVLRALRGLNEDEKYARLWEQFGDRGTNNLFRMEPPGERGQQARDRPTRKP